MKIVKQIVFLFILACGTLASAQNPSQSSSRWSGTGWLLNNGYVVTNHHVANNARSIVLKFPSNDGEWKEFRAEVEVMNEECDLAILHIIDAQPSDFSPIPYTVKMELADVGESVFALGYPLTTTMGEEIKLTTGIISSHSGYQGSTKQYQVSVPLQPGNSGGPLFDDEGHVIGVVSAKHTGTENVSYAVKASYLQPLIRQLSNASNILPSSHCLSGMNLPTKVKQVKGFVCYIECSSHGEAPRDANPKYGAPVIPSGSKVVESPYIDNQRTQLVNIDRVTITDQETIVECTFNTPASYGDRGQISISQETYIKVNDQKYVISKTKNIAFLPERTALPANSLARFTLIFPAIPKGSTSFSLVEPGDSDWRFYGISLKEN